MTISTVFWGFCPSYAEADLSATMSVAKDCAATWCHDQWWSMSWCVTTIPRVEQGGQGIIRLYCNLCMHVLGGFCFFSFLEVLWRTQQCLLTPTCCQRSKKCPRQFGDVLILLVWFLIGPNLGPHFTCKDTALKGVLFLSLWHDVGSS